MKAGSDWNGAGDRRPRDTPTFQDDPGYVRRRLSNGLPVPTFVREKGGDEFQSFHNFRGDQERVSQCDLSFGKEPDETQFSTMSIAKEYLSCPICSDPCIESTSINCGHKFCKDCIEQWRREKPICPICSTLITSLHRLYSDDLLIESQLESLPREVQLRFRNAQNKRLEKLLLEKKSQNVVKRMRQKLDNSLTFLRCKNVASLEDKLSTASHRFQNNIYMWVSEWNVGLIIGVILVGLLLLLANNIKGISNFIQYLWLAIKKYDGIIPESWLKDTRNGFKASVANASLSSNPRESALNVLVKRMDIFEWMFGEN